MCIVLLTFVGHGTKPIWASNATDARKSISGESTPSITSRIANEFTAFKTFFSFTASLIPLESLVLCRRVVRVKFSRINRSDTQTAYQEPKHNQALHQHEIVRKGREKLQQQDVEVESESKGYQR